MVYFPVTSSSATRYIVGDDSGWTIKFDYQAWASNKEFHVGDELVFMYPPGAHSVLKVNGTGFKECIKPPVSEALTTGMDVITLSTPGRKRYICGVGQHCEVGGQKLFITVLPELSGPATAPSAVSSGHGVASTWFQISAATILAIVMVLKV
ncbi:mavicyanin-like [Papaver somniferum]|nr:mavicyanin-like [Papaver somniferum]